MSISDCFFVTIRKTYQYLDDAPTVWDTEAVARDAIAAMERYVVMAEAPAVGIITGTLPTPERVTHAIDVLDDYLQQTRDHPDSLDVRVNDFNVIHHGLHGLPKVTAG